MAGHLADVTTQFKELSPGKRLYFASDFHLGAPNAQDSLERELKIVSWLDDVEKDAEAIALVGDIFDFWFEYKRVIPKGFNHFLAKLTDLRKKGIPVIFFTGNHDLWMFDHFPKEYGIPVYRKPLVFEVGEQKLFVGHGDGLGPGDEFYKMLKKVFESKLAQWAFRWLHPDIGMRLALAWSKNSRISGSHKDQGFKSKEGEWLWHFANDVERMSSHDYYIFGHRHIPLDLKVGENSRYINLGEWVSQFTYVKYDGEKAELLTYTG